MVEFLLKNLVSSGSSGSTKIWSPWQLDKKGQGALRLRSKTLEMTVKEDAKRFNAFYYFATRYVYNTPNLDNNVLCKYIYRFILLIR